MSEKLFSIVVPTKNRGKYLISLIKLFSTIDNNDIELVIQDNSDSNDEVIDYLKDNQNPNIIYNYQPKNLTVVENSDLAVLASSGKYLCFLGDDDLISERSYEFVRYMDQYGVDSAIFNVAKYYWPGTKFVAHRFPNLLIYRFKPSIRIINVENEFANLLKKGAHSLGNMPKLYHGIISRNVLDMVYKTAGTYFPGPSPDMANAVALSQFVKRHIYCDVPLVSSGTSPKSAAGLGTNHKHEGNLRDMDFLPKDIEERWENYIPKVWTGPTIYAQSALEALRQMNIQHFIQKFNYNYMYAAFYVFCPEYRSLFVKEKSTYKKYSYIKFKKSIIILFLIRIKRYIKNIINTRLGVGVKTFDGVIDTYAAERIIDNEIKMIDIERLFIKAGLDKHE